MDADSPLPWEQLDWPSLLDAARAGVEEAITEVFQRLNSYCSMIAGSRLPVDLAPKVGASDIAQKSLLEAFARFPVFSGRSEAEIRSWLATIVQHNVIDAARHYRTAQRRTHLREFHIDSENGAAEIPGSCPTPSLALRRQEQDVALERALAQLSDSQRRVVELRYREGCDYRQIAMAMAISEVAARKLYSRAIEVLRKLLATEDGSPNQSHD